jgi:hypothetical protein
MTAAHSYSQPPPSTARGTVHISHALDQQMRDAAAALGMTKTAWLEAAIRAKLAQDWADHNGGQPFPSAGRARPGRRIGG